MTFASWLVAATVDRGSTAYSVGSHVGRTAIVILVAIVTKSLLPASAFKLRPSAVLRAVGGFLLAMTILGMVAYAVGRAA